jgi:hypothetical protein
MKDIKKCICRAGFYAMTGSVFENWGKLVCLVGMLGEDTPEYYLFACFGADKS